REDSCLVTTRGFQPGRVSLVSFPPPPAACEWISPCAPAVRSPSPNRRERRAIRAPSPARLPLRSLELVLGDPREPLQLIRPGPSSRASTVCRAQRRNLLEHVQELVS